MNTEHTPGPWTLHKHEAYQISYIVRGGEKQNQIAQCFNWQDRGFDVKSEANARLIAAAPDLLAALKIQHECGMPEKSLLYYEEWVEGWRWVHPDGREWEVVGDWCRPMPYHPIVAAAIAKAEGKA